LAWFRNHYTCAECGSEWNDEWSAMCDDDCPECGARHMSPEESDDLTDIIEPCGAEFVVLRSPETAEHKPDYFEVGAFTTRELAEAYVENLVDDEPGVSPSIAPM
jgi:DNA-directed RNA polymerase subunit RPC12/RpoP